MNRYVVWSTHGETPDSQHDIVELRRTDRRVAEDDASLIRDIFKRKAWVQDSKEV